MKKILVILLLFLMLFTFGCSGNNEDNTNEAINNVVEVTDDNVSKESSTVETTPEYGDFKGYLWEVMNGEATVYLFGSVHIANSDIYPFHETVENAYQNSDILVVEADITDTAAIQAIAPLMIYENDRVQNHLSEAGLKKFNEVVEELGVDPKIFEKFKPWAVGSNLMSLQLMHGGYVNSEGVDMYFLNRAQSEEKEIMELEGIRFQIEMFNNFTDLEQEELFITGLGTIEETVADFKELYEMYLLEDDAEMTKFLFETEDVSPETKAIEDIILRDRNVGMANKIDEYLQTDKTYFVVVGLAHYLGEESVVKHLEDKGYSVERK